MPNPIPEWDMARRLVKLIGQRQIIGETTTVREASVALGIGRDRMEAVMNEKGIKYKIFSGLEPSGRDILAIEFVPNNLALDAGIYNRDLDTSYHRIVEQYKSGDIKVAAQRKRIAKRQREKIQVKEFWNHSPEKEKE